MVSVCLSVCLSVCRDEELVFERDPTLQVDVSHTFHTMSSSSALRCCFHLSFAVTLCSYPPFSCNFTLCSPSHLLLRHGSFRAWRIVNIDIFHWWRFCRYFIICRSASHQWSPFLGHNQLYFGERKVLLRSRCLVIETWARNALVRARSQVVVWFSTRNFVAGIQCSACFSTSDCLRWYSWYVIY